MPFRPKINENIKIADKSLRFTEHPSAPGMPYGQTGRRATVYQVKDYQNQLHALKVFTLAFRVSQIENNAAKISSFAKLPGLHACERIVFTPNHQSALLQTYPDLKYAVLMPWVNGLTWQEIILSRRPLTPELCRTIAGSLLDALSGMELKGIAHCDLSGPNVLIDIDKKSKNSPVSLIDLEEMFIPGIEAPRKLPAGSAGYAHREAKSGIWSAQADRFAGAVLLAEILTWCDESVRRIACGEQYFSIEEMQTSSDRFLVIKKALHTRWGEPVANIFTRAWFSSNLAECPSFEEWQRVLNPPKTPEEMLNQVQRMERLGRWIETLHMCDEYLKSEGHPQKDIWLIRALAQKLITLDSEIAKQWHKASESGQTNDWETCLKSITTAYLLAPHVILYQAQREQAEQELESALRIDEVEQALKDNKVDEAIRLLQMTSPTQPRSLVLKIKLEKVIENRKLIRKGLDEALEALRRGDWKAALLACGQVEKNGGSNEPELQTRILQIRHLQNRGRDISERLKFAKQRLEIGDLAKAREATNGVLTLLPMLQEACELFEKIEQAEKDQIVINNAHREASKGHWTDVQNILATLTTKYPYVEDLEKTAQEHISWRARINAARQKWEAQEVLDLLEQKPQGENDWTEMQSWASKIAGLQKTLAIAEKDKDYELIIRTLMALPRNYPLRNQRIEQAQHDLSLIERINRAKRNYDVNTALKISAEYGISHAQLQDLLDWIRLQKLLKEKTSEMMTAYRLDDAKVTLRDLPLDHPLHADLQAWILKQENLRIKAREACESYNTARMMSVMDDLPSDHPMRNQVEEFISITQERDRRLHQARELYDGNTIIELLKEVDTRYPGFQDYLTWANKEILTQEDLRKALIKYDIEKAEEILSTLEKSHPAYEELSTWIINEKKRFKDIHSAKKAFDYQSMKLFLIDVTHAYPNLSDLQDWIIKQEKIDHDVEMALRSIDGNLIGGALKQLPKRHPRYSEWQEALNTRLETLQRLNELLRRTREAIDQKDWDRVLKIHDEFSVLNSPLEEITVLYEEALFQIDFAAITNRVDDLLIKNKFIEALAELETLEKNYPDRNEVEKWLFELHEELTTKAQQLEERKSWKSALILWNYLKKKNIPDDKIHASINRCLKKVRTTWFFRIGIATLIVLVLSGFLVFLFNEWDLQIFDQISETREIEAAKEKETVDQPEMKTQIPSQGIHVTAQPSQVTTLGPKLQTEIPISFGSESLTQNVENRLIANYGSSAVLTSLSLDGTRLYAASGEGIEIYDTRNNVVIRRLSVNLGFSGTWSQILNQDYWSYYRFGRLDITKDEKLILTMNKNAEWILIDEKGNQVIVPDLEKAYRAVLSPDGRWISIDIRKKSWVKGQLIIYDLQKKLIAYSYDSRRPSDLSSVQTFSPDGRYVISYEGMLWDTSTWKLVRDYNEGDFDFSPDSRLLIRKLYPTPFDGGNQVNAIIVYDLKSDKEIKNLPVKKPYLDIHFSQNGSYLALFYRDGEIEIINRQTWETIRELQGEPLGGFNQRWNKSLDIEESTNEGTQYYLDNDGVVKAIHVPGRQSDHWTHFYENRQIHFIDGQSLRFINSLPIDRNQSNDGYVSFSGDQTCTVKYNQDPNCILGRPAVISPMGNLFTVFEKDGNWELREGENGEGASIVSHPPNGPLILSNLELLGFSESHNFLFYNWHNDGAYLLNTKHDAVLRQWPGKKIRNLIISSDERYVAFWLTGLYKPDGSIIVLDLETLGSVFNREWNPAGKMAFSSNNENLFFTREIEDGILYRIPLKESDKYAKYPFPITSGSNFLGKYRLAPNSFEDTIVTLQSHTSTSPDGNKLAVSVDTELFILDSKTGSILKQWQAHPDNIAGMVFSPDGKTLTSISYSGDIRIWNINY